MISYVAVVAVLNLGLGYAFGLHMDRAKRMAEYASNDFLDDEE